MIELSQSNTSSLSIKLSNGSQANLEFDLRIGMISIVPSMTLSSDDASMTLKSKKVTTTVSKYIMRNEDDNSNKRGDVWIQWESTKALESQIKYFRVYRSGKYLGVTRVTCYLDKDASLEELTTTYSIQAISLRNDILCSLDVTV